MLKSSRREDRKSQCQVEAHILAKDPSDSRHSPLSNERSVRVLFLSAAKNSEDVEVYIELEEKPVEFLDECEAPSYVWGERERQHDIYCEGQIIRGTANILSALRRLWPKKRKRALWVDAICINQEDMPERL